MSPSLMLFPVTEHFAKAAAMSGAPVTRATSAHANGWVINEPVYPAGATLQIVRAHRNSCRHSSRKDVSSSGRVRMGNQKILHNIKKGVLIDGARQFAKDCHGLGITIHGTFILGLPGETRETIEETINFAKEINPHTLQVSLAAPYPGTAPTGAGKRLVRRRS